MIFHTFKRRQALNDEIRANFPEQLLHAFAVPDIQRLVTIGRNFGAKPLQTPGGVAIGPEEHGAVIAVNSHDLVPLPSEVNRHVGAN